LRGRRARNDVFGHFVPGKIEIHTTELGVLQDPCKIRGVVFDRADDTADAGVGPDDGGSRMPLEQGFPLVQIRRRTLPTRRTPRCPDRCSAAGVADGRT
jgi:hypothetical protein